MSYKSHLIDPKQIRSIEIYPRRTVELMRFRTNPKTDGCTPVRFWILEKQKLLDRGSPNGSNDEYEIRSKAA